VKCEHYGTTTAWSMSGSSVDGSLFNTARLEISPTWLEYLTVLSIPCEDNLTTASLRLGAVCIGEASERMNFGASHGRMCQLSISTAVIHGFVKYLSTVQQHDNDVELLKVSEGRNKSFCKPLGASHPRLERARLTQYVSTFT